MSGARFNVSWSTVTPESAENGDDAAGGCETGLTLRDALEYVRCTRTAHVDGIQSIETDSYPIGRPRWVTIQNGMEFLTGAYESRTLHIPDSVTRASARRIARVVGARL